ncbi:hypothetical protein AB0K00_23040 [Dactylosporangium sp. NPDC049525]|uniref:hypothetical protein n=1 Tax=Dactylosporangium sp. NPDC049525 TaxID=3154730 RepID=UPI003420A9E6
MREAAGLAAYRAGEWQTALGELRTYHRMTGRQTHIAVIADCERALERPEKAIDLFRTADREKLTAEEIVELLIVAAGARGDMGQHDAAVAMLQVRELTSAPDAVWAARLRYAYADALLRAGRREEAREWFARAADLDEELVTDAAERLLELDGIVLDGDEDGDEDLDEDRATAGDDTDRDDDDADDYDDEDDDEDADDEDDDRDDEDDYDDEEDEEDEEDDDEEDDVEDDEDDDRDDDQDDDADDEDDDDYDDEEEDEDDEDADDEDDRDDEDDYDDEDEDDADNADDDRDGDAPVEAGDDRVTGAARTGGGSDDADGDDDADSDDETGDDDADDDRDGDATRSTGTRPDGDGDETGTTRA